MVLYTPVLEIPLPYGCIFLVSIFVNYYLIILPARSPRSAPLLVTPVIYARLVGFVPVSSLLSIVLSLISDALLPYLAPCDSAYPTAPIVAHISVK